MSVRRRWRDELGERVRDVERERHRRCVDDFFERRNNLELVVEHRSRRQRRDGALDAGVARRARGLAR